MVGTKFYPSTTGKALTGWMYDNAIEGEILESIQKYFSEMQ